MKNIFLFLLLGFACLGWGLYIYQDRRMEEFGKRIEADVLQQVEYRRQQAEALDEKLASKKKAEEFVEQRDYQRQLEDMVSGQFNVYKQDLDASIAQFDQSLKSSVADTQDRLAKTFDQLQGYKQELGSYRLKLGEASKALVETRRDLEAQMLSKTRALEKDVTKALDAQDELRARVSALKKELETGIRALQEEKARKEGEEHAAR